MMNKMPPVYLSFFNCIAVTLCLCIGLLARADESANTEKADSHALTSAQIIEKNLAARGGAEAWKKIDTMVWMGHVESVNAAAPKMQFILGVKRPNKTHFEITSMHQKSLRIYDGKEGWKVRPASNGMPESKPFTDDELKFARDAQVIEGPVMDAVGRGAEIALDGEEDIEGRKTYRLSAKYPSGFNQRVWVDAETFLETRYERPFKSASGAAGVIPITLRNYQDFEGLQLPTTIETGTPSSQRGNLPSDVMVLEKISLNPPLKDDMFTKPPVPGRSRGKVTVDTRTPAPTPPAPRKTPAAPAGQQ
jgi:outer membrane lipoprotein-sorting protein